MPPSTLPTRALSLCAAAVIAVLAARADLAVPLDASWRFHPGEADGADLPAYADQGWRTVDLPHDWSIEGAPSAKAPSLGGEGFYPTGIGWYRLHLKAPEAWRGDCAWLEFDGAYRDSEVWFNGHRLGLRPSGFSTFRYDVTPFLRAGADNVVAVRVDNSAQPNSRYYAGSGLYRHVRLRLAGPVHVLPDSLAVATSALDKGSASVSLKAFVENDGSASNDAVVEAVIRDPSGTVVATGQAPLRLTPLDPAAVGLTLSVTAPLPWTPETPRLYLATLRVMSSGHTLDEASTYFGVRTVRISPTEGLLLNGRPVKLYGGNVHDDNGLLGAAAFDRAERRKAELLKAAGFNAVRTAHNPPAPAFLEACDRVGLLVLEEAFDGWRKKKVAQDYSRDFDAWWTRDLDAMVTRDRNHPSVIAWSVGNEPYDRAGPHGAALAHALADRARLDDPTRPVTAGINGLGAKGDWSSLDPLFSAFDLAGYNYEIARHAADRTRVPSRVILSTESYQTAAFESWSAVNDDPCVAGDFVWSAMDYLGEAGIGQVFAPGETVHAHWEGSHFPWHGAACGDIDLTGSRRPLSHYRAIVWNRGERLYAAVQVPSPDGRPWQPTLWASPPLRADWTWPGHEGHPLQVEVYSRHQAVRLFLNGRLIGEKPTTRAEQFKAVFPVPYAAGELRAVGVDDGRETEAFSLVTTGVPEHLSLVSDRPALDADGQDLAFVTVRVTDGVGRTVQSAAEPVTYALSGPATLAAIGNADLTAPGSYRDNPRAVFEGRALVVVRTQRGAAGRIVLTATAPGLPPATLELTSKTD